jgi:hypothetical protein
MINFKITGTRVDHGGFSHGGKQNRHCEACRKGIGCLLIPLKPMKPRRKSKEKKK